VGLLVPLLALACGGPAREAHPRNVLVILVDTLRADHLTPYGYERDTSPAVQRLLADRGTVVETAYAPASWTLPSMVGLMTGRWPGQLAGGEGAFAIPDGVPTLAERFAARGFETAAFYGNPTLHAGNGFARGFATFYTPPPEIASLSLHADDLNRRAVPWLEEHQHRPFFLYVHYLDPHDPYENPDMPGGRSPWMPDYDGPLTGASVHGVYAGSVPLTDPERDVAYLTALYDGEVRYVDRHIGELLAALDPEVLAHTLVVLTSDHGEELYDHGGWKHGESVYEEQIRVPLVLRWDAGGIPAGGRLAGTVRLLDLAPTLLAAAGPVPGRDPETEEQPEQEDFDGVDLLPALTEGAPLPRRPAYARHFGRGPLRVAAVLDGRKLLLFDAAAPFEPRDSLEEHLWRLDLERLEPVELYDLQADPREQRNLAASRKDAVPSLARILGYHLDRELGEGLRLKIPAAAEEEADGARLGGRLEFDTPPESWRGVFLEPGDQVEIHGAALTFDLLRRKFPKMLLLGGDTGAVLELEAELGGEPVAGERLRIGRGAAYSGGPLGAEQLEAFGGPRSTDEGSPVLALWRQRSPRGGDTGRDEETTRRLKALGYL
jgi:arylsulfatase A-like enzyme